MDGKLGKFPTPLTPETQQLLSAVEKTQKALKEARTLGGPEEPGEAIENTLGELENQMKAYARKLQHGKPDKDLSDEINLKIITIKAGLTDYLSTERITEIFGSDTI